MKVQNQWHLYFPKQKDALAKYIDIINQIAESSTLNSLTSNKRDVIVDTEYQTLSINAVLDSLFTDELLKNALVGDLPLYAAEYGKTPFSQHAYIMDFYNNSAVIKEAVDFIVSDATMAVGSRENLERLYNELLNKDWFMTLLDLEDYIATKDRMFEDYLDQQKWKKMMLTNIAKAGFFSSDRTIAEYNRDIWKLK